MGNTQPNDTPRGKEEAKKGTQNAQVFRRRMCKTIGED
jgi:hypothetical protein